MPQSDVPTRLDRVVKEIPGHRSAVVKYGFVKLLPSHLSSMGDSYEVAPASNGFSGALPVPGAGPVSLRDRSVILARSGDAPVSVSNPRSGAYTHLFTVHVVGVGVRVVRGWASVEVGVPGRAFRVVATHLGADSNATRGEQAAELVHLVASSTRPTLVLGDVNSAASGPRDTAYLMMRQSGFGDAWRVCIHTSPATAVADQRPPWRLARRAHREVFARGAFTATKARLAGPTSSSRTASGPWASDHAGLVARSARPRRGPVRPLP